MHTISNEEILGLLREGDLIFFFMPFFLFPPFPSDERICF